MSDRPRSDQSGVQLARLRASERAMVRIRWAAVAFGVAHALTFYRPYPDGMLRWALVAMAVLAAGNLAVSAAAGRARDARELHRVGLLALCLDTATIMALVLVYTFDPETAVWAVCYILPLEGAVRFQLRGALATMGAVAVLYAFREVWGARAYGNELWAFSVSFRMGIGFIIAAVAGWMARSLVRDRRQAEEATARYESMLAAMSHLGEGMAVADQERLVHANEALGRMLGYTPAELEAMPSYLDLLHPSGRGAMGILDDLAPSGTRFETTAFHRDGHPVVLEVGIKPVELDGERRAIAIVRDVTERRRAEEELATAYERDRQVVKHLQKLDAVKTDFLATVSHELRTPVTKIFGFSATLLARWEAMDEELRRDCVRSIASGGEQLDRLVSGLLDFGRVEHGKLLLDLAPCPLAEVVEASRRDLGAVLDGHALEVDVPAGTHVLANFDGLVRVLDNLLTNAVKFSPDGSTVTVRARDRGEDQVLVEVEDRGIGIPSEETDRIFDRFHRVWRDPTAPSGTGIGLAVVKEFVEAQGGRAWAASAEHGGAVLSFTLWRPGVLPPGVGPVSPALGNPATG